MVATARGDAAGRHLLRHDGMGERERRRRSKRRTAAITLGDGTDGDDRRRRLRALRAWNMYAGTAPDSMLRQNSVPTGAGAAMAAAEAGGERRSAGHRRSPRQYTAPVSDHGRCRG